MVMDKHRIISDRTQCKPVLYICTASPAYPNTHKAYTCIDKTEILKLN